VSSSELLASQILTELAGHGVEGSSIRVVDHDVKPGIEGDLGEGDQWPGIRDSIRDSDILVVCTPTWRTRSPQTYFRR
jgi:multimeric flavodoxin WrbA